MKNVNNWIVGVGIVFWLAETWYFGWNAKPRGDAERRCDAFASTLILLGAIGYANDWARDVTDRLARIERGIK